MTYPNPLIPGFNPDPSIVQDGEDYYLVTSSFEFLPGLPVYHSRDLINWRQIGNVIDRSEQLRIDGVPTNGGVWAPTIRKHGEKFYVAVKNAAMGRPGSRGMLIFSASNPAGPWSNGVDVEGPQGIDPDLAWDEAGNCYMSFSGLNFSTGEAVHHGIQQVQVNPDTGEVLGPVVDLWHGGGGMFPEGPHLYWINGFWYLLAAEGGTDRGHTVTVARSKKITGPFESAPNNPILTARSQFRTVQNTGHADLFQTPSGDWACVCLGVRAVGLSNAFSPLGRETFITKVDWVDGWPVAEPVEVNDVLPAPSFTDDFRTETLNSCWVGIRRYPNEVVSLTPDGLGIASTGLTISDLAPDCIAKRQTFLIGQVDAKILTTGTAGLSVRYNEEAHYDIEVQPNQIVARFSVNLITQEFSVEREPNFDSVYIAFRERPAGFSIGGVAPDYVELGWTDSSGQLHEVATFDGRFISQEANSSFTGRMLAVYSVTGQTVLAEYRETPGIAKPSTLANNFNEAI
jgi:xylan 1,4-beta-xylosidase